MGAPRPGRQSRSRGKLLGMRNRLRARYDGSFVARPLCEWVYEHKLGRVCFGLAWQTGSDW